MLKISVPASSANVGPGFDSAGIALSRYLTLTVERAREWEFVHTNSVVPMVDHYKNHFIYKIASQVAEWHHGELPACKVTMHSEIPLARGLGSSASAIIASIELTNQMCQLNLSEEDKLALAVKIEGHPDNVAAALLGSFVISVKIDESTNYKKLPLLNMDLVVYIPSFELKTEDSRKVLPESFDMKEAATASGISNLMISALLTGDFPLAGTMMEADLFHESYRAKLIPNYHDIRSHARELGAFGTVISGAGPTMISFVAKGEGERIAKEMSRIYADYEIDAVSIDETGLVVEKSCS